MRKLLAAIFALTLVVLGSAVYADEYITIDNSKYPACEVNPQTFVDCWAKASGYDPSKVIFVGSGTTNAMDITAPKTTTVKVLTSACTKPYAPVGLSFIESTKTVSWDAVSGATSYNVRFADISAGKEYNYDGIKNTWYTPPSDILVAGHSYSWWIHAVGGCGISDASGSKFSIGAVLIPVPTTPTPVYPTPAPVYPTPTYPANGFLRIRVLTNYGAPIVGAQVDAYSTSVDPTSYTDGNGYVLFQLAPGTYRVTASAGGYQSQSLNLNVFSGQTSEFEFRLTPIAVAPVYPVYPIYPSPSYGTLTLTVKDGNTNMPISGATVTAYSTSTDPTSYTDGNGVISFTLPAGTYSITVSKSGYQVSSFARNIYSGQTTSEVVSLYSSASFSPALISASFTTPSNTLTGQTVFSTVTLTNSGGTSTSVTLSPSLVRTDGTGSEAMACNTNTILIPAYSSNNVLCSGIPAAATNYQVRVAYSYSSGSNTINSGVFSVSGSGTTVTPTPTPGVNSCSLGLDYTSLSATSIASGDILNVVVRERMAYSGYVNPWATVVVSVEGPSSSSQIASQTRVYSFTSSGSTQEQTFSFVTTNWPVGSYRVYIDSTGVNSCSTISKTQLGLLQVNPASTASITSVSSAPIGNAIYVQKFAETTPEEKPVVKTQVVYPTFSTTETAVLWDQVALVGLLLMIPVAIAGTWFFVRRGSSQVPAVQHAVHRSQGCEECTDHKLLPKGI